MTREEQIAELAGNCDQEVHRQQMNNTDPNRDHVRDCIHMYLRIAWDNGMYAANLASNSPQLQCYTKEQRERMARGHSI